MLSIRKIFDTYEFFWIIKIPTGILPIGIRLLCKKIKILSLAAILPDMKKVKNFPYLCVFRLNVVNIVLFCISNKFFGGCNSVYNFLMEQKTCYILLNRLIVYIFPINFMFWFAWFKIQDCRFCQYNYVSVIVIYI